MIPDGGVEQLDRGNVKRHRRLVEEPDRPRRGKEPGQRELSFLPGREETGGKAGQGAETKRFKGILEPAVAVSQKFGPEGEVLADA